MAGQRKTPTCEAVAALRLSAGEANEQVGLRSFGGRAGGDVSIRQTIGDSTAHRAGSGYDSPDFGFAAHREFTLSTVVLGVSVGGISD